MQCTSCGATIPPGANHCPSCGTPVYTPGAFQETVRSSPQLPAQQENAASSYTPGMFQEAVSPHGNMPSDKTVPANAFNPHGAATPVPQNSYGQPVYPAVQPSPAYNQQPPVFLPQPPQPPQPPASKRGLSRSVIVALVVVALLLVASGFSLIYYTTVYHPNQVHAEATATAQTVQTRIARATATANAQATGTAVAITNATATANAQATANVVGTATALQSIYTQATSGNPAITSSLSGNTGNNWDIDQAQGGGGCAFTGGSYHASLYAKGFYFPCIAQNTNFSNLAFQVQMKITRGDYGGLVFRANSAAVKFYNFRVGQDGSYNLFVSQDSTHGNDLLFGNSPAIKKNVGQTNLITVIARGSNIYFYVNKQYVGSVSDGTYKSGQIGFFAEDRTNPTDVAFSSLQVWQL